MATRRRAGARSDPAPSPGLAALTALAVALPALVEGKVLANHTTCQGQLPFTGTLDGMGYVTGDGSVNGPTLAMVHNGGVSITRVCQDSWNPYKFTPFFLLGQTFSYTVDLSKVACACNLAVYFVQEPAFDDRGMPTPGECSFSPYYCDANRVCGQWCPELDIMEANSAVFAATPHACDASSTPHFNNCDRGGRGQNTKYFANGYGPGPGHTIDTSQPFQVHTTFEGSPSTPTSGPRLTKMETVLQQGHTKLVLTNNADQNYLQQVANALDRGMALRITYWGGSADTMKWLDEPPCNNYQVCDQNTAGLATLSDFSLSPGYTPVTPPVPIILGPERHQSPWWLGPFVACVVLFCTGVILTKLCQSGYLKRIVPATYERVTTSKQETPTPKAQYPGGRGRGGRHKDGSPQYGDRDAGPSGGEASIDESSSSSASQGPGPIMVRFQQLRADIGALDCTVDMVYAKGAWDQMCDTAYRTFRPPLRVGDKVTVVKPYPEKGKPQLDVGMLGKVKEVAGHKVKVVFEGTSSPSSREWRRWGGGSGVPETEMELAPEHQLVVETEFQTKLRRYMPIALFAIFCGAAIAVVSIIVRALAGPGSAAPSGGPQPPPTPPIPAGGCCSWQAGYCGKTSDYCMVQDHCLQFCKGTWIMPG